MISLLKIDLKNCINNFKFKICFFSVWIISIFSYICICTQYFNADSLDLQSTNSLSLIINSDARQIYFILLFILPLISAFIYSDSFIYEQKNNISNYYFLRTNKTLYFLSKMITNFVVVLFTIFIPLAFNEILTNIAIPDIGVLSGSCTPAYQLILNDPNISGRFLNELFLTKPFLYNYFIIFITALFGSLISTIAFNISLLFTMKNITLLITTFLCVNISVFILPMKYQFQMYIQTWPGKTHDFYITLLGWIFICIATGTIGLWKGTRINE